MCVNKTDWSYVDKWAKKIRAINQMGGKCNKCGNSNIFQLGFHHIKDKDFSISGIYHKWSEIIKELDKCELLCHNCHQDVHMSNNIKDNSYRKNKELFLTYKGQKCEKCGYDKNKGSLTFHHNIPKEKLFAISEYPIRNIQELDEYIKIELDKCSILCQNCHTEFHIDVDKFNNLKDKIYYKIENFKENNYILPKEEIYKMYDSGIKQTDIVKYFNSKKSTISMIIKNRNNIITPRKINPNKPTFEEITKEYETSSQRKLALKYNVNVNQIRKWLKLI